MTLCKNTLIVFTTLTESPSFLFLLYNTFTFIHVYISIGIGRGIYICLKVNTHSYFIRWKHSISRIDFKVLCKLFRRVARGILRLLLYLVPVVPVQSAIYILMVIGKHCQRYKDTC